MITWLGYLTPAMPFLAFLIITAFTKKYRMLSAVISITAVFISFILALSILYLQLCAPSNYEHNIPWLYLGKMQISIGIILNQLSAVMLIVVTAVSLLVQVYSVGYMKGDEGFSKFFSFISFFSFSMLGIVVSNNLVQIYMFWELVGLCSYLLIGFWYHKPEAAEAGKKAFVVTRFGDFGFLIGILILSFKAGTFNFLEIVTFIKAGGLDQNTLTLVVILILCGAIGKSGQFPLHVWLPDAMEGPTPVSALIHAATMVAAGVFMVARLFGIFIGSAEAMMVVAYIGGFTAIFAASIGLVQDDIKRVLAYSTVSQLGYMMLALGVGGYTAGVFHLYTHAFFKALLFLAAGSVIHAVHVNDIWKMGGLIKKMPVTAITFAIGALSLSGIFPLAGFWSKDEILSVLHESGNMWLYYVAVATAFLTAFYMTRLFFVAFMGKPRDEEAYNHAHESPAVMTVPLIIFALLAAIAGLVAVPGLGKSFQTFLYYGSHPHESVFHMDIAIKSSAVALSGIIIAALIYGAGVVKPEKLRKISGILYTILKNKYYIDEIYMFFIRIMFFTVSEAVKWFDRHVVDGAVNLVAFFARFAGAKLKLTITGRLQNYALTIFAGLVVIIITFAIYNPDALKMFGGK